MDAASRDARALLYVPVSHIVPIPLHIFLGLANDHLRKLVDIAKLIEPSIVDEIDSTLRQHGIDNRAWYGDLVGELFLMGSGA